MKFKQTLNLSLVWNDFSQIYVLDVHKDFNLASYEHHLNIISLTSKQSTKTLFLLYLFSNLVCIFSGWCPRLLLVYLEVNGWRKTIQVLSICLLFSSHLYSSTITVILNNKNFIFKKIGRFAIQSDQIVIFVIT